jgi:hypothetical protein
MVEHYLAKVNTRVRFPSLAPAALSPDNIGIFLCLRCQKGVNFPLEIQDKKPLD